MCENRAYTLLHMTQPVTVKVTGGHAFTYLDLTKKELLLGPKLTRHLMSISARSQPQ